MLTTLTAQAGAYTECHVRGYIQRIARIGECSVAQPVPARAEQVIAFQFGDPCLIRRFGKTTRAADLVIAGPQTRGLSSLLLQGNIEAFYIFLRPAALNALFGISMAELADRSIEAPALFGSSILELHEQLAEASTFAERVEAAETYLQRRITKPISHRTEWVVKRILSAHGNVSIEYLATKVSLSSRHLERTFAEHVGMSPKVFARIVRFQAALAYKERRPATTWAATAQEFQYFDQMHLVREFRELSGETPSRLLVSLPARV
jgi:AraC-like DNA-binding protein